MTSKISSDLPPVMKNYLLTRSHSRRCFPRRKNLFFSWRFFANRTRSLRYPSLVQLAIICKWRRRHFWEFNETPRDESWGLEIYRFRQSEIIGVKQQKWSSELEREGSITADVKIGQIQCSFLLLLRCTHKWRLGWLLGAQRYLAPRPLWRGLVPHKTSDNEISFNFFPSPLARRQQQTRWGREMKHKISSK